MLNTYPYAILFIDDDEIICKNYKEGLKKDFSIVYIAHNGQEAYNIYSNNQIDIIISDLNMPIMDGIELIKKIRLKNKKIPIIVLSSYCDKDTLFSLIDKKITSYLTKPIKRIELKSALKTAIDEIDNKKDSIINLEYPYYWDKSSLELKSFTTKVSLTLQEKKLLRILFKKINSTVSFEILQTELWDEINPKSLNRLKTIIKNIRKKIDINLISNDYSLGYSICL